MKYELVGTRNVSSANRGTHDRRPVLRIVTGARRGFNRPRETCSANPQAACYSRLSTLPKPQNLKIRSVTIQAK